MSILRSPLLVNADFSTPVVVEPHLYEWVASPQPGVERVMLDRIGGEKARATSIVKYAPKVSFPTHVHSCGEEILVLSGTFSEGSVDYPAGWYMRNPPGSSHQPSSIEGTVIFVKLEQMIPDERVAVRINTVESERWSSHAGRQRCQLFNSVIEDVSLQRISAAQRLFDDAIAGAEILVLVGELKHDGQSLAKGTWVRLPAGKYSQIIGGADGATVYLKTGQLGMSFESEAAT